MDKYILNKIKKLTSFKYKIDNGKCIYLDFTDSENVYCGLFRHSTKKKEILDLINRLKNLKYLNLRKNNIQQIPQLDLPFLEHLDLGSNYIAKIPDWLISCNLTYLNLGVNNLEKIPEWFSDKKFEVLKIHKNNILHIPLIKNGIKHLNLYQNKIRSIPSFIWDISSMEYFCCGMTDIREIPNQISNLKNLKWLSLVVNKIEKIPNEFCCLEKLIGVRLSKNKISSLPDDIGNLQNLRQFVLYDNRIKKIPDSFYNLNLEFLNISYNPLNKIDKLKLTQKYSFI